MITLRRCAAVGALVLLVTAGTSAIDTRSEVRIETDTAPLTRFILHTSEKARYSLLAVVPEAGEATTVTPGVSSDWISAGALELRGLPSFIANGASTSIETQLDATRVLVSSSFDPPGRRGAFVHLPDRSILVGGLYHPSDGSAILLALSPSFASERHVELLARASLPESADESDDGWLVTQPRATGLLTHVAANLAASSPRWHASLRAALSSGARTPPGAAGSVALRFGAAGDGLGILAMASTPDYRNPAGKPIGTLHRACVETECTWGPFVSFSSSADLAYRMPDSPKPVGDGSSLDTHLELESTLAFADVLSLNIVRESENERVEIRHAGSISGELDTLRVSLDVERTDREIELEGRVSTSIGRQRGTLVSRVERTNSFWLGTSKLSLELVAGSLTVSSAAELTDYPIGSSTAADSEWLASEHLSAIVTIGLKTSGRERSQVATRPTHRRESPPVPVGSP